ncbi:hypothetical protein D9M70_535450 [compost metagenome]
MTTSNIDQFNEITGRVFAHLYQAFPIPTDLRPTVVGIEEASPGDYDPVTGTSIGQEPRTHEEQLFAHSVEWLCRTGYLTAERYAMSDHFTKAVLTAKGLEVLNAVPGSLKQKSSIGEQLTEASKSGGMELLRSITTEALGIGVRLLMKGSGLDVTPAA